MNLYRYVGNNPVRYNDPSGNINPVALVVGGGAALVIGVKWVVEDYAKGQEGDIYQAGLKSQDWINEQLKKVGIESEVKVLDPEKDFKDKNKKNELACIR